MQFYCIVLFSLSCLLLQFDKVAAQSFSCRNMTDFIRQTAVRLNISQPLGNGQGNMSRGLGWGMGGRPDRPGSDFRRDFNMTGMNLTFPAGGWNFTRGGWGEAPPRRDFNFTMINMTYPIAVVPANAPLPMPPVAVPFPFPPPMPGFFNNTGFNNSRPPGDPMERRERLCNCSEFLEAAKYMFGDGYQIALANSSFENCSTTAVATSSKASGYPVLNIAFFVASLFALSIFN